MSLNLDEESLRNIVRNVLAQMGNEPKQTCSCKNKASAPNVYVASSSSSSNNGIFTDVKQAAEAAFEGYKQLCKGGFADANCVFRVVKGGFSKLRFCFYGNVR